jgi:hypothetical protein
MAKNGTLFFSRISSKTCRPVSASHTLTTASRTCDAAVVTIRFPSGLKPR